jgi:class 3 adenylate cyclase/tetratricopeptide (TPR) repeat protein
MRCPRCGAEIPAGMKFCGQCGASLGTACPSCGSSNPPEHRYCGQCGALLPPDGRPPGRAFPGVQDGATPEPYTPKPTTAPLPASSRRALPGEIKQVTVLFCDIVGSTPLAERLGAEAMRDLVGAFLEKSLDEVHRYGGTAPQFLGDGFMALFGAPVTQEDHVRRALLAAIAIQQALGVQPDADDSLTMDLPVRMGIHTGPVVLGPVGSLRMEATAIGDTANVAARLQEAAEAGTILLSEETRRLAQDYARVEPVGPLVLKGKDDPVSAYRLLGVSHRRSGLRETAVAHTTTFVDRESERAILHNFLRLVENGRSQVVGIVGEPGIGKSRLLAEFRRELADGRVSWVEGRCVSYGIAIPYWLLLDLLRSNCGIIETDTPEIITEKVRLALQALDMDVEQDSPILLHLLAISELGGSPALLNPEAVKARAFEILRQACIKASLKRALVLVVEDLHWVDKISEEFVGFLVANAPDARILLLGTYRPGYRPPWVDKSYAGQTPLHPLSRNDSLQMVRSVLSEESLIDLVTEEIVAKAEGNPLFLEQLALHAGENFRSALMVPNTIHDVVMARIDRLPAETKQLLQTAAVIGREFSLRLLSAVLNWVGRLEAQLRELIRLEFIYERVEPEGATYVFRHALTQEAAYGTLLERHRRAHHGAVGRALEALYDGRIEEVAELLALHFGLSDDAEKAVDYAILAAEKAQCRWANSEALNYFNDALHRLDAMPDTEPNRLRRIDAVIKQAEVRYALGQYARNIQDLEGIRDIVDVIGDPCRRAAWHYWIGLQHSVGGGRPEVAITHCAEAAKIASAASLDELKALAESCLAQAYVVAGRLNDAVEAGKSALAYFESRGDLWWAARTLWFLVMAANYLGEWDTSLTYSRRALEYARAVQDPRFKSVEALGLWRMGSTYVQQGDLKRALEYCHNALTLEPIPRDAMMAKAAIAYAEIKAGRVDAGIAQLSEVVAWFRQSDHRYAYLRYALWLAEGYLCGGDCDSAQALTDEVLNSSRSMGYVHCEGLASWLMGECLAAKASSAAVDYVDTALRILKATDARNDLAKAMVTRAAIYQASGDPAAARHTLNKAYELFAALGTQDEPTRVGAALAALSRGFPIPLLARRQ